MLTISNTSGLLMDLSPDTAITVERENPLFNDPDKIFQDTIYNAKAPRTPANDVFFGFGHRVEAQKGAYELEVQVHQHGQHFFTGKCVYKLVSDEYDFYLKVNFGSLAEKVKEVYLPQIRTNDRYTTSNKDHGQMEQLMMETVQHPDNYPFCFFPVENTKMFDAPSGNEGNYAESGWVNQFSIDYSSFALGKTNWAPANKYYLNPEVPFFKLTYILQNVIRYLGFIPAGGFLNDPEAQKLYLYTRKAIEGATLPGSNFRGDILPSMAYMPYITVADFLKQLRERLHLSMHFDLVSGTCEMESFASIKNAEITDITSYIERVDENSPQDQKGYVVVLKKDDQDEAYNNPFRLSVGEKTTDSATELDCSTLESNTGGYWANKFPTTSQFVLNDAMYWKPNFQPGQDPYYPNPFSWNVSEGVESRNAWPLKLLKYNGIYYFGGSYFWPEAAPFALDEKDAAYYQFLNDSKNLKVIASIPPAFLRNIKLTRRIGFYSREQVWTECIIKKMEYDLGGSSELIKVTFQLMSLNYDISTTYQFDRAQEDTEITQANFMSLKAFWEPEKTGFSELSLEMTSTTAGHTFTVPTIRNQADSWGTGGDLVWAEKSAPDLNVSSQNVTLIVRQGRPRYLERYGVRYNFSFNGEYSYYNFGLVTWNRQDQGAWLIVF